MPNVFYTKHKVIFMLRTTKVDLARGDSISIRAVLPIAQQSFVERAADVVSAVHGQRGFGIRYPCTGRHSGNSASVTNRCCRVANG